MSNLEYDMDKVETRTLSRPTCTYTTRYRRVLTILLFILSTPLALYHFVPSFRSVADSAIYSISDNVLGQTSRGDFCTSEIGDRHCCMVYLEAMPCVDECWKQHIDRETQALTIEYDQCADVCLQRYNGLCEVAESGNPMAGHYRGT